MPDSVEITLPPRPEFVGAVRHVFSALGRLAGLSADGVEDLKLAVTEAATNALTRQAPADGGAEVRIVTMQVPGGLRVEVSDSGPPVDPASLRGDVDEASSQEFSFETGLSLPLIRGLVEDLELEPGPDGGLTVRFSIPAEADPA